MAGKLECKGKPVLVIGLARTGVATALFCAERGAMVTATDTRSADELGEGLAKLRDAGVQLQLGGYSDAILHGQELVVPSPGVPADSPLLINAGELKITVWSEIELAYRFLDGRLIGITGSNGKTTTTTLVDHILRHAGLSTVLAGNIGTPLIAQVKETNKDTITVAELSSFQLQLIETFPSAPTLLPRLGFSRTKYRRTRQFLIWMTPRAARSLLRDRKYFGSAGKSMLSKVLL